MDDGEAIGGLTQNHSLRSKISGSLLIDRRSSIISLLFGNELAFNKVWLLGQAKTWRENEQENLFGTGVA